MKVVKRARQLWDRLALRERRMLGLMAAVLLAALVVGVGIVPAVRSLRAAPAQLESLDTQLQGMQKLASEARGMQSRPALSRADALRALELGLQQRLGAGARMSVAGERVTVSMKNAAPDGLAQWLGQARANARAMTTQANLTKGSGGWDGTVVLVLPPNP